MLDPAIKQAIWEYVDALGPFDDARWNEPRTGVPVPELPCRLESEEEATRMLAWVEEETNNPVYRYAARKAFLAISPEGSAAAAHLQASVASAALVVGEYDEVLSLTASWVGVASPAASKRFDQHRQMLAMRAKAHRNLGQFEEALACYRHLLQACDSPELRYEKVIQLHRIGKVYQNYAQQTSLFRSCMLGAFQELKQVSAELTGPWVLRSRAATLDLLGQHHQWLAKVARSEADFRQALRCFATAERLHRRTQNKSGLARARAHRYQLLMSQGSGVNYEEIIDRYYREVMNVVTDPRGRAVRSLHYAEMLDQVGAHAEANLPLQDAIGVSKRLRDYLTYVRARLLQASLFSDALKRRGRLDDNAEAMAQEIYAILDEARSKAKDYGLHRQEMEANKMLLAHLVEHPNAVTEPQRIREVVNRTQEISAILLARASATHETLQRAIRHPDAQPPEFKYIAPAMQTALFSDLMKDFQYMYSNATANFHAVAELLDQAGRHAGAQVGLQSGVMLARTMVHDLDHILKPAERYREQLDTLRTLVTRLRQGVEPPTEAERAEMEQHIEQLELFTQGLADLRRRLYGLADQHLAGTWTDVRAMVDRAISCVIAGEQLTLEQVDTSGITAEMWVCQIGSLFEATLENLIRNAAISAAESGLPDDGRPRVRVRLVRSRTGSGENESRELRLSILNLSPPGGEEQLKEGFVHAGSSTRGGHGVGLEVTKMTFEAILNAPPVVSRENGYTCVTFSFKPNMVTITDRAEVARGERGGHRRWR